MAMLQSLRQAFKTFASSPGFSRVLQHVDVISVEEGKVHCEMPVLEEHLNMAGTLHGGFTATLVDQVTTMALTTCKEPVFGVSVDLGVSYVSSAKPGDTLSIKSEVLKRGGTLGFTKLTIENQDGKLIATGHHTKFLKTKY